MTHETEKSPLLLMTGSADVEPKRGLARIYYYRNYPAAMERAGATVVNVSRCDRASAERLAALADGLYLTGGGDVAPERYGETAAPCCGGPEEDRDELELTLGQAFLDAGKPIFGVCRGLQLLNVLLGGTLWQDLPAQAGLDHPNDSVHWVKTAVGTPFRDLFGERFLVNSFHHQAVKDLAPGLVPAVWDETGQIVEAFVHGSLPICAVQWHPERMTGAERYTRQGPDMAPLFRFFLEQCGGKR